MPRLVKILLGVVGVLIALLVVIVVLIKVELTPERIRETVIPLAEEKLQRKVEVGEIRIGLFSGVSLAGLKVMQRDGSEEFVSAQAMSLSYKLWPLLTGRIVVDEVRLEQPKIVVIREPDGRFNFNDLLSPQPGEQTTKTVNPDAGPKAPAAEAARAINLLVKEVAIDNGELLFIDRLQNAKSPYRYSLKQLNLQAKQITLDKSFPVKLSALLNGSKIELAGDYAIDKMSGDFDLQLAPLDLMQFSPYFRAALPGKLGSAVLDLNLEVQLVADKVSSKGRIFLDKLDLVLKDLPDAALAQAALRVDYAINYDINRQSLDISTLLIDLNGIALGAQGSLQLAGEEPQLSASVLLDKFDLRKLSQGLPAGLVQKLQQYSLAGLVAGKVDLAGRLSAGAKLLKGARFNLDQVQANVAGMRTGISGTVNYAEQVAQADKLELSLDDQTVLLSFKVSDLLGELLRGKFQIEADSLDLNRLIPAPVADNSTINKRAGSSPAADKLPPVERRKTLAEDIGPFDIPLEMGGTLSVNRLLYKQLSMAKVQAEMLLKNNHLVISKLRSDIGGGELLANTDIDLGVKGLAYSGQLNLGQANLVALVSGLFPQAQQSVSGLLEWQNNFSGRGTLPENLLKQLQVKGAVRVGKGKVTGSPLLEQFSSLLGSPDLKVLSFNEFTGNYNLQNGVANLAADLDSSKTKLRPEGTIGVDGVMDLKLAARVAPELMSNLGALKGLKQFMTDAEGWGVFPLKIKGTLNQPKISYDDKELKNLASERATQEVSDQLLKKLGVDKAAENVPAKQLLEGTLKKLFGQ